MVSNYARLASMHPATWFGGNLGFLSGFALVNGVLIATFKLIPDPSMSNVMDGIPWWLAVLSVSIGVGHLLFVIALWRKRDLISVRSALVKSLTVGAIGLLVLTVAGVWVGLPWPWSLGSAFVTVTQIIFLLLSFTLSEARLIGES